MRWESGARVPLIPFSHGYLFALCSHVEAPVLDVRPIVLDAQQIQEKTVPVPNNLTICVKSSAHAKETL